MRELSAAPDGREVAQLFRKRAELVDHDLSKALVECLRVAEMVRREPQTFAALQDQIGCSTRTLRRHIARLRRAGYGIYFSYILNGYISTGFEWDAPRRTA
ncbi:MAG TPA: HTH domain-containing protein [Candidatus Baltobacteraceae bacterium]|nr:HTH domain-containing protein [Candidatus Baltobacteraceae bacterium]